MTDTSKFYGNYFRSVRVLEQLMRTDSERRWLLAMPHGQPTQTENVVYLGCNVLRTANLAEDLADVLDALQVNYTAVGGPAFCCGVIHRRMGDIEPSSKMFSRTMMLFDTFKSHRIINWCPSCEDQMDHMVDDFSTLPFDVQHATGFLLPRIAGASSLTPVPMRVSLHTHGGTDRSDRATNDAEQLLAAIPGLDVTALPSDPEIEAHCSSTGCVRRLGRQRYSQIIEKQIAEALDNQSDAIVSIYHSCHRELCKQAGDRLPIINYTALLARTLGKIPHDDRYARYVRPGGLDAALKELAPRIRDLGLRADTAREVLQREFAPS
jgi:Fe-S oxidoreductase